jgi:hypothetical protein
MGLFSSWEKEWDKKGHISSLDFQNKYFTDFEKGKINKANQLAEGMVQSALELGAKAGWTKQETLDKFNQKIHNQPNRLDYDDKILGATGEVIGELMIAAPASVLGWFGTGGKIAQIYKQGMFGGLWSYFTTPMKEADQRFSAATKSAAIGSTVTAGAGLLSRAVEKTTHFDFKDNIAAVRDAAVQLGVSPKLLGDFTGADATRAAEALSRSRGGGALPLLKQNVNELAKAGGDIEKLVTKGSIYTGQAGENVAKAIQTNYRQAAKEGNRLYGNLEKIAEANNLTNISPNETKATILSVLDEYSDLFQTLERPALSAKLNAMAGKLSEQQVTQRAGMIVDETGKPIIPEITRPAEFSFKDIRLAREALTDALQAAKKQNKLGSKEAIKLDEIIRAMDADIESWGATAAKNTKVSEAWKTARDFWRGNVVPLRDADLAIAMVKDPNSGEIKADVSKLIGRIISPETPMQEGAKRAAEMVSTVIPADVKNDVAAAVFAAARKDATDANGLFDPVRFANYLQSRKLNLQPFVDEKLDPLLNKFNFLAQQLTRQTSAAGQSLDDVAKTALRVGTGAAIGGVPGAVIGSTPVNRIMEAIARSAFDTTAGRAVMISAKTLDDFTPLLTGGVAASRKESAGINEPAILEWQLPPELEAAPINKPMFNYTLPPELHDESKDNILKIIDDEAKKSGLTNYIDILRRIPELESNFNQSAVSPKNAIGVMQLRPSTAAELGVDPTSLEDNVRGGVRYWGKMLSKFNDPVLATAAYNAGPRNVIDAGYAVPKFVETQNYVKSIFGQRDESSLRLPEITVEETRLPQ